MAQIDREPSPSFQGADQGGRLVGTDLPGRAAADAVQVAVGGLGLDVELLATVRTVAVAQEPELLEDVERSIDGRWRRRRIKLAAAFDELGARDVTIGVRQDLDEGPPLRRPTQTARPEPVADAGPR